METDDDTSCAREFRSLKSEGYICVHVVQLSQTISRTHLPVGFDRLANISVALVYGDHATARQNRHNMIPATRSKTILVLPKWFERNSIIF